ncbi:MAG: hypothetical protein ACRDRG_10550 [Pseudonocardiaceae bacterium]
MNRIGLSAVIIAAVSGLICCSGQPGAPPTGVHPSVPAPAGSVAHSPAPASRTTPSPSNLLEVAGSGQPDPSGVGREPSGSSPADSVADLPTPVSHSTPTPSGPLNATQLQSALLTLDDLPAGWVIDSGETDDPPAAAVECPLPALGTFRTPVAHADVRFRANSLSPLLAHSVASFEQDPTGEVDEDFAQALDGCQEYTSTTEGGTSITFRAEPLPFSDLGDHTAAMRLVGKSSHQFAVTVDVVFVAVGHAVSSLLLGATELDPEAVDSAELERLARISVDRIKHAPTR